MTSIVTLPSAPAPLTASFKLLSKATEMSGPLGGATQRVLRVGSRFSVDFQFGPMEYGDARQWLARLVAAEALPVAMLFPQRGFRPFAPFAPGGSVSVAGPPSPTVNTGGVLALKGGLAGFQIVSGQFFHLAASADGRRYLHQVRDDVQIGADGTATLAIQPPLRVAPADGDALEFVAPMIEGFVTTGWSWDIVWVNRVGLKFTIIEDR